MRERKRVVGKGEERGIGKKESGRKKKAADGAALGDGKEEKGLRINWYRPSNFLCIACGKWQTRKSRRAHRV
jgi:hypothetical protein